MRKNFEIGYRNDNHIQVRINMIVEKYKILIYNVFIFLQSKILISLEKWVTIHLTTV